MKINISKIIKTVFLIFIVSVFGLLSCVEEYWPELSDDYQTVLIIEGRITNEPGPYTIKISTSNSLDSIPYGNDPAYDFKGLSGATVSIQDEDGNSELLTQTGSGIYQTSEGGIQGIIGGKYKLTILTPNGKSYESTFEELLQPTAIENVDYIEEQKRQIINNEEVVDEGLRFRVTSMEALENAGNFFWELEETYEYHSAYKIEYIYEGILDVDHSDNAPWGLDIVHNPDTLYYCWNTKIVREVFTENTEPLAVRKVVNLPLNFISYDDDKMKYKYSLQVNQYNVSSGAHQFIKKINDQNKAQEGLYVSQPYQIIGNISNTEDANEPVLGYFMAASKADSKRISYKAPFELELDTFRLCEVLAWDYNEYASSSNSQVYRQMRYYTEAWEYPVYLTHAWVCIAPGARPKIYAVKFAAVGDECVDCRKKQMGGTVQKPDYWDDIN